MNILILGASGMLGHRLWMDLSSKGHKVTGCSRKSIAQINLKHEVLKSLETADLRSLFKTNKPDVVLNCIGVIKQSSDIDNYKNTIFINSTLPHILAGLAIELDFRLIHFSTDCVFSGKKEIGSYSDFEEQDSSDLYGASKSVGEVNDCEQALTIRTSIIGRELFNKNSLIEWFLGQNGQSVKGFEKAIFSGLPTGEVADVLDKYILGDKSLKGVYNLSVDPINKFELLSLVKKRFDLNIVIEPNNSFVMNRALNSKRIQEKTGYNPPPWEELIEKLHIQDDFYKQDFEVK